MLLRIVRNCNSLLKCNYLKNEIFALYFLFNWWNLHQILNIFLKKKIVIAHVFPKLQTAKDFVTPLSKRRRFRTSFHSQHVTSTFINIFLTLRGNNLENSSIIEIWYHRGVCKDIDCRLQVSFSGLWEFAIPYSNKIILKTKNIFSVFCSVYGIFITFKKFSKIGRSS